MIETALGPMAEEMLEHRQILTDNERYSAVRDEWWYEGVEVRSDLHITVKAVEGMAGNFGGLG